MINSITILGAGTMGRGIALLFVKTGLNVILYDPFEKALELARTKLATPLNLGYTTDLRKAVSDADFIIEAAPEDLVVKRQLYSEIAPYLSHKAIIASNTSTFPLQTLSENLPFASRMLIVHFFNPADIIPLVEIVRLETTEADIAEVVADFLKEAGKVPVVLKKDIKGFIANRLQAAVLREACYLLREGVATADAIDSVMKQSIGTRWALSGPFEIADYGGLDVWQKVLTNLLPVLDNSTDVPEVISEKVAKHNLGLKTGKGFFSYNQNPEKQAEDWNKKLVQILKIEKG